MISIRRGSVLGEAFVVGVLTFVVAFGLTLPQVQAACVQCCKYLMAYNPKNNTNDAEDRPGCYAYAVKQAGGNVPTGIWIAPVRVCDGIITNPFPLMIQRLKCPTCNDDCPMQLPSFASTGNLCNNDIMVPLQYCSTPKLSSTSVSTP
jgi:hypothetical protein